LFLDFTEEEQSFRADVRGLLEERLRTIGRASSPVRRTGVGVSSSVKNSETEAG